MQTFQEIKDMWIAADKADIDSFNDEFAWRHASLEERFAFAEHRRARTAGAMLAVLNRLIETEQATSSGGAQG